MKFFVYWVLGLSALMLGARPGVMQSAIAQVLPTPETAQLSPADEPDPRREARVGRVDPNRPIRIEVSNGGDATVLFELTQPVVLQRELPPYGEISFGTTHTSYLPPPLYLLAYPTDAEIGINLYVVSIENNVIQVVVSEQLSDIPGDRSIEIQEDGSVYAL